MTIPERVKMLRKARGWTQAELGRRTNLLPAYITLIETGARPRPGIEICKRLAAAFDITIDELVYGPSPNAPSDGRVAASSGLTSEAGAA